MCHFASYIMLFQKFKVYNLTALGVEGLLAYYDIMSFELSLYQNFHFYTDVKLFLVLK